MANDLMIDLETLDTSPYCVILTIGVVRFDPYGQGVAERWTFKPTIEDQTEIYNRIICDNTIKWWSQQNPEALDEAFNEDGRICFKDCMEEVYKIGWNRLKKNLWL